MSETLSKKELNNLTIKAKIYNWSEKQLEEEKTKAIQHKIDFSYSETEKELEERAKELGFENYAQQRLQSFSKKRDEFSLDKVVVPPPFVKKVEALEFTEANIPGEIKIDISGKLLKTFFDYEGKIGSLVDQYNNFITYTFPQQVVSKTLEIENGIISFENVIANRPEIKPLIGNMRPLYPQEARNSGYSYTSDIYVDMVLNKGKMGEERIDKVFLGKVPVMLGSNLDWLSSMSEKQRKDKGESLSDPPGYFIIKGAEKVILQQEKLRPNRFMVFSGSSKGDVVCKITNNTLAGSTQISMVKGKKSGALKMHLGFLGRLNCAASNKIGKTISVLQVYRLLGVTEPKTMLNYIFLFTKPEYHKKIYVILQPNIVKLSKIGDDIEYISKKTGTGDLDYNIKKSNIMQELKNQLFPQVEHDNIQGKIYMLSIMIARIAEYLIGVRNLDDRDNWGNKQLATAGKSMELLFSSIWKELINSIQGEIGAKNLNSINSVKAAFPANFITDNFIESFSANKWGVQSKNSYMKKENITDILKRDSILSVYSHLTKVNTPGSDKVKNSKLRMVQMSQLGYIDPGETPEGKQCGLAKNVSMTTYVSLDRPEEIIIETVRNYVSDLRKDDQINPFILNGVFQGWVNGKVLKEICVDMKRSLKLPKDTCIVLEKDGFFNIYTDAGRPTRPLMIVDEDGTLVIEKKNLWKSDFETLIREGCIEYIDAWEQENIMLAQKLEDIDYRKRDIEMAERSVKQIQEKITDTKRYIDEEDEQKDKMFLSQAEAALKELLDLPRYTHSEMDPTAILSIAIGIIPLLETNPGPRLTYQAGMGKQSLGIYHSNHSKRFDTSAKVLAYPSRPMFEAQLNDIIGLGELPAGETVIVGITTFTGFSQEDAIVMAQGSVDRGLFRSVVYKTYKSVLKPNEKFTRPTMKKGEEKKYDAIDENGIPILGASVEEDHVIIGKVRFNKRTEKKEDASTRVEVKQAGVIDKVLVTTNADNNRVIKVKIRQVRKPVIGDKFASRYAQKGTIGLIIPDEDMPYTASGMRPDILINPHCFPKDTPVSTHKGYAKRISDFSQEGGEDVWAWDIEEKSFKVSKSMGMESKGIKKLIKVCLEDGREIKCTPDHRFLTVKNDKYEWVEAKDLKSHKVVCGLEMPLDKPENDMGSTWALQSADYTFNMSTPNNREKSLAFARILGYTLTDGCVSNISDSIEDDILLITGKRSLKFPESLVSYIKSLFSSDDFPNFLNFSNCPSSFIREFLAGLFSRKNNFKLNEEKLNSLLIKLNVSFLDINQIKTNSDFIKKIGFRYLEETPSFNLEVIDIFDAGEEEVFDIGVYEQHNFMAHGCVVHNCIPSRMTIGKLIEIVTSKTAAFTGERVNATAFRKFDVKDFMRNLTQYGYASSGKERMFSGYTGEPLEAMIFTGPCYYQALRHQVADKIQMRAKGNVSQLTRQPVEGRKRGGGLRVGEMERDAIISHGASNFLRERLCLVSDAYETVYCSTCGNIAISNVVEEKYICRNCDDKAEFGVCTVPFAFKTLSQLLMGAGFQTKFKMREIPK